jgi:hypothetical protein
LVLQIPSATVLLIQLLGPKSWKCFLGYTFLRPTSAVRWRRNILTYII